MLSIHLQRSVVKRGRQRSLPPKRCLVPCFWNFPPGSLPTVHSENLLKESLVYFYLFLFVLLIKGERSRPLTTQSSLLVHPWTVIESGRFALQSSRKKCSSKIVQQQHTLAHEQKEICSPFRMSACREIIFISSSWSELRRSIFLPHMT